MHSKFCVEQAHTFNSNIKFSLQSYKVESLSLRPAPTKRRIPKQLESLVQMISPLIPLLRGILMQIMTVSYTSWQNGKVFPLGETENGISIYEAETIYHAKENIAIIQKIVIPLQVLKNRSE